MENWKANDIFQKALLRFNRLLSCRTVNPVSRGPYFLNENEHFDIYFIFTVNVSLFPPTQYIFGLTVIQRLLDCLLCYKVIVEAYIYK